MRPPPSPLLSRASSVSSLNALYITPVAARWLQTTRTARLLNIFERACNLVNQNNDVLAVVTSERGLTPFGLVIADSTPSPFQSLVESSPVIVEESRLSIGDLSISTNLASAWAPTPDWASLRALFSDEPDRLTQLAGLAFELASPGSLLDLYLPESVNDPNSISPALRKRIEQGANTLIEGLKRDGEDCLEGVRLLAGLGGGLTPAGDDFVVGALLAVWAGLYGPVRESLVRSIVETDAPLTTTLSAAYLHAAARGECIIYWHRLFAALQGSDTDELREATAALMSIGHTSGADGLAGFLAARLL